MIGIEAATVTNGYQWVKASLVAAYWMVQPMSFDLIL
jgi:hypothetical protein